MSTVFLITKLYVPVARPELVPRPHLIDRLNESKSRIEDRAVWVDF
jgi:ATP/maltotriose-dependent transcriptional regulator MalT